MTEDEKIAELSGVREHAEGLPVELVRDGESGRLCIMALNEGGHNCTMVDLDDLLGAMQARGGTAKFLVSTREHVRDSILARLREPDEAMVGAVSKALSPDNYLASRTLRTACRALADVLEKGQSDAE